MRDEDGHKAMLAAGKKWREVKASAKRMWSDWTTVIGPGLVKARAEAMALAHTNKPAGKGYNTQMSGLLVEYHLDDMEGVARNDTMAIMEHLASVENWRSKQPNRERLNHPTNVWRGYKASDDYKAVLMERGEYKPKSEKAPHEKPTLLEEAVALRDQVKDLSGRIEEAEQERDLARDELAQLQAKQPPGPSTFKPLHEINPDVLTLDPENALKTLVAHMGNAGFSKQMAAQLADHGWCDALDIIEAAKFLNDVAAELKAKMKSKAATQASKPKKGGKAIATHKGLGLSIPLPDAES
jgi:hypothetical protein